MSIQLHILQCRMNLPFSVYVFIEIAIHSLDIIEHLLCAMHWIVQCEQSNGKNSHRLNLELTWEAGEIRFQIMGCSNNC